MTSLKAAKERLESIIKKGRVDLYKPIHIAEVLHHARKNSAFDITALDDYKNPSLKWRDEVCRRLLGKVSTSSAQYQHNVWSENAITPEMLAVLSKENKLTGGHVERFIYAAFEGRQSTVSGIFAALEVAKPGDFHLEALLALFVTTPGIRRSIDKAYEIVTYALFETVICAFTAKVTVSVPDAKLPLLKEFEDLAQTLLGLAPGFSSWEGDAHIYRVGVTNAADRGLDMWANFGPAIQVKHLTLDEGLANSIVDQVESDHIVVVCTEKDESAVKAIAKQIGWGKRVRGIVTERDLVAWYEKCLRGKFSKDLGEPLIAYLRKGFVAEFPQLNQVKDFMEERAYTKMKTSELWKTDIDRVLTT